MNRLLPALGFAAACAAPAASPETSETASPIIGGTLVTANEFPTVVALETGPGDWFCTGTLIAKTWVLSAAHCVEGAPPGAVKIRIDDLDVNDAVGGVQYTVKTIHSHPGYGPDWGQDIALLELATPIDRPVTPIHRTPIAVDTAVKQVGYGVTNDQGAGGGLLRKLDEHNVDCALTNDPGITNANVLCFSPADGGGCYGDSGGPTFLDVGGKLEVVGVTSGGTSQNCSDSWGIWTLVPAELAWLDGIMMAAPEPPAPEPEPMPEPEPEPMPEPMPEPPDDDDGGCQTTGGGTGAAFALLLLGVLRRRRR